MQFITVKIEKPGDTNFVLGQTHFIKSVKDMHEALVGAVPGIKFGLAFCEASGKCLVRWSGTDPAMTELAKKNATAIGAGHSFIIFLGDGFYPLNVLNTLKMVPEVCRIFCATADPTEVILAETEQGRGILGVVDGFPPKGVEDEGEIKRRKDFLRKTGTSCDRSRWHPQWRTAHGKDEATTSQETGHEVSEPPKEVAEGQGQGQHRQEEMKAEAEGRTPMETWKHLRAILLLPGIVMVVVPVVILWLTGPDTLGLWRSAL